MQCASARTLRVVTIVATRLVWLGLARLYIMHPGRGGC